MSFTKAHAKILAETMDADSLAAFTIIAGLGADTGRMTEAVCEGLVDLGVIRHDRDLIHGTPVVVLTPRGKKVRDALRESETGGKR